MEFRIDDFLLVRRIIGRFIYLLSGRLYYVEFNLFKVFMKDDVSLY